MEDKPLVFVDVETTGLNPSLHRVIEIAALRYEHGTITSSVATLLDPGIAIPPMISRITNITDGDVAGQPVFETIAEELRRLMDGAIFVAHNVRFDYSFLKNEFGRLGMPFRPKQLCTVKLSRALYPEMRSHKLADLIRYHGFAPAQRHRAYDDAAVLIEFWQRIISRHTPETITQAIQKQLRSPSIPQHIDPETVKAIPSRPGVYIFEDESGIPVYIGKSINLRQRVMGHFIRDSAEQKEFKISQNVRHIRTVETAGELSALLLESQLVKTHMPVYNRRLRRQQKLTVTQKTYDEAGYIRLATRELSIADLRETGGIGAIHARRSAARSSLENAIATYELCPKLCGIENPQGACFRYQLGRCRGACAGKESAEAYNERVETVYQDRGVSPWPYDGAITLVESRPDTDLTTTYRVNNWIIESAVTTPESASYFPPRTSSFFDYDTYAILRSYLLRHPERLDIEGA